MKQGALLIAVLMMTLLWPLAVSADEDDNERSWWMPSPGAAILGGGGIYHSVPCGCVDRGLWNVELAGRVHFGNIGALEAGVQRGSMLLGGRFPSNGWSVGAQVSILPQRNRWWDGLSVRSGYRQWAVMGMRSEGTSGFYSALNWAVEVFPYIYLEADAVTGRTFEVMPHWNLEGRLGVSTRF